MPNSVFLPSTSISRKRRFALGALVRLQAFRRAPLRYMQAVAWRIRGLKLRARHRFSELMGGAPQAYLLWITTREAEQHATLLDAASSTAVVAPSVIIVVDARQNGGGLEDTLRTINQACTIARACGGQEPPDTILLGGDPQTVHKQGILYAADLCTLRGMLAAAGPLPRVLTLQPGDWLAPVALVAYRAALAANPQADLLYADDDLIDDDARRHTPHFKPEWNAELARHHDFLTNSCVFTCDPRQVRETWPQDTVRACTRIHRVPLVLHHRRARPEPMVPSSTPVHATPADLPHVSVVIPTRDQAALLRVCLGGLAATQYPSFDITIIDNGSDDFDTLSYLEELAARGVRVVRDPSPFNYAAMHNRVVSSLSGPLICFLNNDIEVLRPDWLEMMATAALRSDVGAVGARLLYPNGTIQHAGIVTGVGGGAAHAHRFLAPDRAGYFARAYLPQFVSAVTAACLVLNKNRFEAVGGFDEKNFAVAFNDVDLCLKLTAHGWKSFYEPRAVLIHHESISRGTDDTPEKHRRFAGELAALKRIWNTDCKVDPYHHPELSPYSEHFVVRL